MLSIARIKGQRSIDYYVRVSAEGYYLQGLTREHRWVGEGAAQLGLVGSCDSDAVRNLLHGFHPKNERPLCQNSGHDNRTAGWDLTFSVPKGVSVLWAFGSPEVQSIVEAAHAEAVDQTIAFLERYVAVGRRGKGGEDVEPVRLVGVEIRHFTSRENDPQVHSHLLVSNVGVRADGTTGGIESRPLFLAKLVSGSHYRAQLWSILQDKLQVELRQHGYGYEIAGFNDELLRTFSQRRALIEEHLEETGGISNRAKDISTLATRSAKKDVPLSILMREWAQKAGEKGFRKEQIADLMFHSARAPRRKNLLRIVRERCDSLARKWGRFSRLDILRVAYDHAPGCGMSVAETEELVTSYLNRSRQIIKVPGYGPDIFTSPEVVRCEQELVRLVGLDSRKIIKGVQDRESITAFPIGDARSQALSTMLCGPGRVVFVDGIAGGAKSDVLKTAHGIWHKNKKRVLGIAPTAGEATSLMAVEGIPAVSAQQLIGNPKWPLENGVAPEILVIDSANSIDNFALVALLRRAKKAGCRVVALGDRRGLAPRLAGGGFELMTQRNVGAALRETMRIADSTGRKAVELMHGGDVRSAITTLMTEDRVHVLPTRDDAIVKAATDYLSVSPRYIKSAILCGSDLEVTRVNLLVQQILLKNNAVDRKSVRFRNKRFYQGELVTIKRSNKLYGVRAGERAALVAVHPLLGYVKLACTDGKVKILPTSYLEHVELGYAFNTLKHPHLVCDHAFILIGGDHQHLELTYRQLSRATESSHIYCDESEAGKGLSEMIRQSSRERQKHLTIVAPQRKEQ